MPLAEIEFVSSTAEQKSSQQAPPPCKKIMSASDAPSRVSTVYSVPRKHSGPRGSAAGSAGTSNSKVFTPLSAVGVLIGVNMPTYLSSPCS